MRKLVVFFVGLLFVVTMAAVAQGGEKPKGFEFVVGPRLGVSYVLTTPEEYTAQIAELYPDSQYYPVSTLFGVNFEQRILLGNTRSHFVFQELVLVSGLEQSVALPLGAVLIGYRDWSGFEIGMGPVINFAGVGVVIAVGWTLSMNGVYVPIDISVALPNDERPAGVTITTGFNFSVRRQL